jgi:hypothetical protein
MLLELYLNSGGLHSAGAFRALLDNLVNQRWKSGKEKQRTYPGIDHASAATIFRTAFTVVVGNSVRNGELRYFIYSFVSSTHWAISPNYIWLRSSWCRLCGGLFLWPSPRPTQSGKSSARFGAVDCGRTWDIK